MKKLLMISLILLISNTIIWCEDDIQRIHKRGETAYTIGDWINAIENLYAYKILNSKNMTNEEKAGLDKAIKYCEDQLIEKPKKDEGIYYDKNNNLHRITITSGGTLLTADGAFSIQSGSAYINSSGKITPIRIKSSGTLITQDEDIVDLDFENGPILINQYGFVTNIDKASYKLIDSILEAKAELPYSSFANRIEKMQVEAIPKYFP
jgi:hypothetical protein